MTYEWRGSGGVVMLMETMMIMMMISVKVIIVVVMVMVTKDDHNMPLTYIIGRGGQHQLISVSTEDLLDVITAICRIIKSIANYPRLQI